MVDANPWLAGHLATSNGSTILKCSTTESSTESCFQLQRETPDTGASSLDECARWCLQPAFSKGCLGSGSAILNDPNQPVFRVSITPITSTEGPKKFALQCSLSHVVGDGFTFYTLRSMLSESSKVSALDPV